MKVSPSAKYQLIYEMTNQSENALSVSKLCERLLVCHVQDIMTGFPMQKNGGREKNRTMLILNWCFQRINIEDMIKGLVEYI